MLAYLLMSPVVHLLVCYHLCLNVQAPNVFAAALVAIVERAAVAAILVAVV